MTAKSLLTKQLTKMQKIKKVLCSKIMYYVIYYYKQKKQD